MSSDSSTVVSSRSHDVRTRHFCVAHSKLGMLLSLYRIQFISFGSPWCTLLSLLFQCVRALFRTLFHRIWLQFQLLLKTSEVALQIFPVLGYFSYERYRIGWLQRFIVTHALSFTLLIPCGDSNKLN